MVLSTFIGAGIQPPVAEVFPVVVRDVSDGTEHMLELVSGTIALLGIALAAFLFLGNRRLVTGLAKVPMASALISLWKNAWGFDMLAACSGFLFSLATGAKFIESGMYKKVLVIGADKMSSITNYKDRNNCILFGDGAGSVLLEPAKEEGFGIIDELLHIDGKGAEFLYMKGGGSLNPPSHETVDNDMHYVYQEGKTVFKEAVKGMLPKNKLARDLITKLKVYSGAEHPHAIQKPEALTILQ